MKRIEYDPEMYWPTILINEGTPYVLKKLTRKGVNDPCSMCDLRNFNRDQHGYCQITHLCTSDDRDESWYFEEDWTIYDKPMSEFLNQDSMTIEESLSDEDRAKNLTLKHDL